jgi:hypothetical protein
MTVESGATTVWTIPRAQMETSLPQLAGQVFGQRGYPTEVRVMRTPQLLTDASVDTADALRGWLDQVMPRVAPGSVLAVETHDIRTGGMLLPVGLEVLPGAPPGRRGLPLKRIIRVVPAEATALCAQATDPAEFTHRYLLVASRDRTARAPP